MAQISLKTRISLLKNIELFSELNTEELKVLAKYCAFQQYQTTDIIFSEGQKSDHLYMVYSGEVLIIKDLQNQDSLDVAKFIDGESFGELDFFDKSPRTATAIVTNNAKLLVFPKPGVTFEDLHQRYPQLSAKILHDLLAEIAGRIRKTNELISEKTPWISDLKRQIHTDKLTGIYNKRYFDEEFIDQTHNFAEPISLVMIKPDDFKRINDNYGHGAGDKVLRMLAVFINSVLKDNYIPIRYKSDEFAIILQKTDSVKALDFVATLYATILDMDLGHITKNEIKQITISVGVSTYPDQVENPNDLTEKAYNKMMSARNDGGNRVYG